MILRYLFCYKNKHSIFLIVCILFSFLCHAQKSKRSLEADLKRYKENLALLRQRNTNSYAMNNNPFFLFGMGNRKKLVYKDGELKDALSGEVIKKWIEKKELIVPNDYSAYVETPSGKGITIFENEKGVYIREGNTVNAITEGSLKLPDFKGKKYAELLKVLHHEIVINVIGGKPVPNFLIYPKPWYRDASLMGMVMKETGNLNLIKDWILNIKDPFDRNNSGTSEADNPGELLYLFSLVADATHPFVKVILDSVKQFNKENYISGQTDYNNHYVFQTKWIKFGLKSLGLPDPYVIPKAFDSYSSLFWWDYKDQHVDGTKFNVTDSKDYPYLTWAEDHFYHEKKGYVTNQIYPLSWEKNACCAICEPIKVIDKQWVQNKLGSPHTWHAAEMFLLLINE
jgi:hypothetical protein